MQEILDLGWSDLPYLPYSSDLAPRDFPFFSFSKNALSAKIFFQRSGENIYGKLLHLETSLKGHDNLSDCKYTIH